MGGQGSGKPKAALLRLDGHQIHANGEISKTDFFEFLKLPEGEYDIEMTPEQALQFRNHVVRLRLGTSAMIPMLCSGPACPVKQCPFHDGKNWPLTKPCLVENTLIAAMTESYIEDLVIDPNSPTEMVLVNKLVECDIIDYRANAGLSGGADAEAQTLLKTTVTHTEFGDNEIVGVHPLLESKERTHRIRMQTLESLAATRREKYKRAAALKKRDDYGASNQLSDLREAFDRTQKLKDEDQFSSLVRDAAALDAAAGVVDADWEEK